MRRLEQTQSSGALYSIPNSARGRLEAQRGGERFMGYAQATARLRRAITKVAATGTVATVREVFRD
jgi:hypothetical protein